MIRLEWVSGCGWRRLYFNIQEAMAQGVNKSFNYNEVELAGGGACAVCTRKLRCATEKEILSIHSGEERTFPQQWQNRKRGSKQE